MSFRGVCPGGLKAGSYLTFSGLLQCFLVVVKCRSGWDKRGGSRVIDTGDFDDCHQVFGGNLFCDSATIRIPYYVFCSFDIFVEDLPFTLACLAFST
ncbi:hypothetical protein Rcae01_03432 [Novipirellula caenicola]|uniref:Uncharacterized protein n=1 Tax=Novipirellula caenicola TaxID=1536901 RepID=A0ABP9VS36_9BACT